MAKVYATGKRKTAVAKVWLKPGSGKILVNGLDLNTWLGGHEAIKLKVVQPLLLTKQESSVDVTATTLGGGYSALRCRGGSCGKRPASAFGNGERCRSKV